MIADALSNIRLYEKIHPRFPKAINYLLNTDFNSIEPGKYPIDGDDIFAIVMEYTTKPIDECLLENHQKYIDIQYIVEGEESMGVSVFTGQTPDQPYDDSKDIAFYDRKYSSLVTLNKGEFTIFFPHDLHMPCIKVHEAIMIKKVVIKILSKP